MIIHPEEGKQGRCHARFSVPRVVLLQDGNVKRWIPHWIRLVHQQQAGDLQLALHRCELQATLGIRVSVCVQKMTHNPGGADPCQGIWHEHSENMGIEASKMENTWGYIWKILEMGTHPLVIQQFTVEKMASLVHVCSVICLLGVALNYHKVVTRVIFSKKDRVDI